MYGGIGFKGQSRLFLSHLQPTCWGQWVMETKPPVALVSFYWLLSSTLLYCYALILLLRINYTKNHYGHKKLSMIKRSPKLL